MSALTQAAAPLTGHEPAGKVVLTEAGYRLVEHARRAMSEMNDGKRRVAEVGDQVTGSLAVGAIPTIAPFLLPAAVSAFLRRWIGFKKINPTTKQDSKPGLRPAVNNSRKITSPHPNTG